MSWFGNNLGSLLGWRSAARDVREEMRLHVELRARELEAAGLAPAAARARASREVGRPDDVADVVARLGASTDRASSIRQRCDELIQDLTYASRSFRRSPGFTSLAVLTIAFGLGANVAIFGVVNVAFLTPLPFDPDNTLVRVREYRLFADGRRVNGDASRRTADAVAALPDVFRESVAISGTGRALARDEGAIRVAGSRVGPRFTAVVGVTPLIGRTFTPEEEQAGDGSGVVLISDRLWRTAFAADPRVLGRTIRLDGQPAAIVGVLPRRFHVPYDTDIWFPSRFGESERSIFILARLAPGVSLEQARAALEPVGRDLNVRYPDVLRGLRITAVQARDYFMDDDGRVALALMGAVAFLLLIACSNVALLLTTKFAARQREVAVRAALGCGRGRQIRQFVTEGLVLFVAGGALGMLIAVWLKDSLAIFLPEVLATQVGIQGITVDARILGFAAGLSVAAGTGFGLVAALRAAKADLVDGLKASGRSLAGSASRGTLGGLVVAEVALSLVLLTAAGVMVDTFRRLHARDRGFDTSRVLTMRADLNAARYESAEARRAFLGTALERLRALPGVEAAGATTVNPLCCGNWGMGVTPEGQPIVPAAQTPVVQHFIVTPGYFETIRHRLLEGRDFTAADTEGAEMTVIVDRAFAERFWPGQHAIGRRVKRGARDSPYPWLTIVGVVTAALEEGEYTESWYLPHSQHPTGPSANGAHLMVRASGEPAALVPAVRAIAKDLDPNLALYEITTMDSIRGEHLEKDRLGAVVTSVFAVAGLLLAGLGLYGVLSFAVAQDTREIGVRLAIGASRRDVMRLVVGRGLRMTAVGLALGTAAAWIAARVFGSILGDPQLDPRIIAAGAAMLLLAALLATIVPARRAVKMDPLVALRAE
jgi:putative ABC transport system permease protein